MLDNKLTDYNEIKALADNPLQLATRLMAVEKRAREWKIGIDPERRLGLVEQLKALADQSRTHPEEAHQEAEALLLEFINDKEIQDAYDAITRYYA